ncbi:hypothetical protein Tco_0839576 [Tanacetum coccineum]|uniref:Uncharacterized protein n=1 Tax=Tanacetum coccineum TaxID=301880 RepID=A0ABQ5AVI4_9ASTR
MESPNPTLSPYALRRFKLQLEREGIFHGVNAKTCTSATQNTLRKFLPQKVNATDRLKQGGTNQTSEDFTSCEPSAYRLRSEPVNDEEPIPEVQLTALHNILANEQQQTEHAEPNYDTLL